MLQHCPDCDGVLMTYVAAEAIDAGGPELGAQPHPVAVLMCDECSHLVTVLTFDEVIVLLNHPRTVS